MLLSKRTKEILDSKGVTQEALDLIFNDLSEREKNPMLPISKKAKAVLNAFEQRQRSSGETFVCLKDGSPDWMTCLIRAAHAEMLPDDYKFKFIQEALEAIADASVLDEIALEADIYTVDLLKWLSSNLTRTSYMNEAILEGLTHTNYDFINHLMGAQILEKEEVLHILIENLECLEEDHF